MTCETCSAELVTDRIGRKFCQPCRSAKARASGRHLVIARQGVKPDVCLNGHEYVEGSFIVRKVDNSRVCIECRRARGRKHDEERRRVRRVKTRAEAWVDEIVVDRIVFNSNLKPGRALTRAEWSEVFRRAGHLNQNILAERADCQPRTVERQRARYNLAKGATLVAA